MCFYLDELMSEYVGHFLADNWFFFFNESVVNVSVESKLFPKKNGFLPWPFSQIKEWQLIKSTKSALDRFLEDLIQVKGGFSLWVSREYWRHRITNRKKKKTEPIFSI